VALHALEPTIPAAGPAELRASVCDGGRAAAAALAPAVAAAAALLAHVGLPSRQSPLPTRPYPILLAGLLAAALLLAVAQGAWRRLRPWVLHQAPLMAGAVGVLGLWDLVTLKLAWMPLPYFPGPDMVLRGMWDDRAVLLDSAYHSLMLLLSGYCAGVAAGLVTGVLIGWFRVVRYWGMPVLKAVGPIPATAFIPLAMALFADAFLSGSLLIALAVWFPVTMLTSSGIANVPVSYLDVARTLGAGRSYLIFRVAIPAALPSIFLGLFMGLGASFLTLIVAETVGVQSGLGWYLKWQQGYVEYAKVYAALIIMAAFFSGLMTLLFRVRDRGAGVAEGCDPVVSATSPGTAAEASSLLMRDVGKLFRAADGAAVLALDRFSLAIAAGEMVSLVGPERVRQVDAPAPDRGAGPAHVGGVAGRGRADHRPRRRARADVPGPEPVPVAERPPQRRVRAGRRAACSAGTATRWRSSCGWWASTRSPGCIRTSSPAAWPSGRPWRGR
jgi:NitT/TauT family transport system permease protein